MKLSMSMVQWYLRDYMQKAHIQNDSLSIQGLRFLSGNMPRMHADFMYLGEASDYISDKRYDQAYIIVHRENYILFFQADFEDLLNGLLAAFDFYGTWEHEMAHASAFGLSLQKILDLSHEVLYNPVTVMDLEGNIVALNSLDVPEDDLYWRYKQENGQEHPAIFSNQWFTPEGAPVRELSRTPQLVQNVQQGQPPLIMMYLFQDEEPVAVFYILIANRDLLTMDMQLAGEISKYLIFSEEFFKRNVRLRSTEKLMQEFLDCRMEHGAEGESAAEKLQKSVGDGQWRLALLRHISRKDLIFSKSMLRMLKNETKVPCIFYRDDILLLIPESRQASSSTGRSHRTACSWPCPCPRQIFSAFPYAMSRRSLRWDRLRTGRESTSAKRSRSLILKNRYRRCFPPRSSGIRLLRSWKNMTVRTIRCCGKAFLYS